MDRNEVKEKLNFYMQKMAKNKNTMNALLDIKALDVDESITHVEFEFEPKEWQYNEYGGIHGGIISTIFDYAMGLPLGCVGKGYPSTVEMSVSYVRAAIGKKFVIDVEITHVGRNLGSTVAKLFNEDKSRLCATSSATYTLLRELPKTAKLGNENGSE